MADLSITGIIRQFRARTKPYYVRELIGSSSSINLRDTLESLAIQDRSYDWKENCGGGKTFGGTAKYQQVWTNIIVKINLVFDASIPVATRNSLRDTWRNAIQTNWSFKWGCSRSGEYTCRLTFEVQWTDTSPHHTVQVIVGPSRSNSGKWDTMDTGAVISHEFGHLLGLSDEYSAPTECALRDPVKTGTIMDSNSSCFPSRLMKQFASNIGSDITPIPNYSYDPALCK